jgi:hypothetical protein
MISAIANQAGLAPRGEPVALKEGSARDLLRKWKIAARQHFQVGQKLFKACDIVEGITADASSSYKNH